MTKLGDGNGMPWGKATASLMLGQQRSAYEGQLPNSPVGRSPLRHQGRNQARNRGLCHFLMNSSALGDLLYLWKQLDAPNMPSSPWCHPLGLVSSEGIS